jgi:hypothetical protein
MKFLAGDVQGTTLEIIHGDICYRVDIDSITCILFDKIAKVYEVYAPGLDHVKVRSDQASFDAVKHLYDSADLYQS